MLGFHGCDEILLSKRLTGFSALEKKEKGPLLQAPSLEVEHLLRLHKILKEGSCTVDRIGAGSFLCAIYGRARWSDLRHVNHVRFDAQKRNGTFDLYTSEHKTSSSGLRREQFLPFVIPNEGLIEGDWVSEYIQLCATEGFDWQRIPYGPLLPAPKASGGWCARPLSTGEAAKWLRGLLAGCKDVDRIRAHSMKVTLCVCAARAGFSKEHRATLSHHACSLHGSDIVYSRELQTAAIRRLQMLLRRIRLSLQSGTSDGNVAEVTAPLDTRRVSAVRTPTLSLGAPETPFPAGVEVLEPKVPEENAIVISEPEVECKEEDVGGFQNSCINACREYHEFAEDVHLGGLVQVDSSSGSESSSSSSTDSEDSSSEHFGNAMPRPIFVETVPEGMKYHVHKKSKIMHSSKIGSSLATCKINLNQNFTETERTLTFKYPKCMKCFAKDHNRLRTVDDVANFMDGLSKRRRSS